MPLGDRNKILANANVTHQIYIQRLAENYGNEIVRRIDASETDLLKLLRIRIDRFGPVRPDAKTAKKFGDIQKGVKDIRKTAIIEARNYVSDELNELAENEAVFAGKTTESVLEDITTKAVPNVLLNRIVTHGVFSGGSIKEWFDNLGDSDLNSIMNHVRGSMAQGLTTEQIVRGLAGTSRGNFQDGLLNITRNQARTVARTVTNGVSNSARLSFYSQNSDIVSGVTFLATLDGRTSAICRALDGTTWKFPEQSEEVKTPPLHPNCRSTLAPEVEGLENINGNRPSANSDFEKDAERRYNEAQKEKGSPKRWKDLAPATRDRKYYEEIKLYQKETGKKPFKQVHAKTTYKTYFDNQPAQFQKDVLGPTRYQLYKSGEYDLDKFVDFKTGKQFTIAQLAEKDKSAVDNARKEADKVRARERELAKRQEVAPTPATAPREPREKIVKDPKVDPNSIPLSKYITQIDPKVKEPADRALKEIDKIHNVRGLNPIPIKSSRAKNWEGTFTHEKDVREQFFIPENVREATLKNPDVPNARALNIKIATAGKHQALTCCHEIGHYIDTSTLSDRERGGILDAIKKTKAHEKNLAQRYRNHGRYLLDSNEQFARAYAQYIAEVSKDPVLIKELAEQNLIDESGLYAHQWGKDDFKEVKAEFEKLFKAKKWRK